MINKGSYIQWEPGGVMFLKELGYVTHLSDCGNYVFISDSSTGLPIQECRVVDKFYRVMLTYPGNMAPEWHRFETLAMAENFAKGKLDHRDDYAIIFCIPAKVDNDLIPLDEVDVAYLDNHHFYRRAKLPVAMRDQLNTPSDLIVHFRQLYNG